MHFYHQEDLNDCGLACLSMLINYHQKQKISPYLLKKMNPEINNGGITFFDLINLGVQFGLKGTAYFCEFELLIKQTQLPILINIKGENDLSHFVLLTQVDAKSVRILDPALRFGKRDLKWNDFKSIYLGQIVVFQKIKNWKPRIQWKEIFYYLQKYWLWLLFATLTIIVTNYLWFLANFFIRDLENWLVSKQLNRLVIIKFIFYLLGGGCGYFFQICCFHQIQQSLWQHLLAIHLKSLRSIEDGYQPNRDFWELITHQQQTLTLFFTVITKFIGNFALFPLLISTIVQSNRWVLLMIILFVAINGSINNICFLNRLKLLDREDWERLNYYNHVATYLSSFLHLKKRQYDHFSYQILQKKQRKYFKTEGRNYYWIALSDLNQQLTQRIFSLAFWFLIFFLILKQQMPATDLLILSIQSQLLISLSTDWIHSFTWFYHQKIYLSNFSKVINPSKNLQSPSYSMKRGDMIAFQLENFGFEIPGHFYQLKNLTLKLPLQITGNSKLLDGFYKACFHKKDGLLINNYSLANYEKDLFAIDYEAVPIDSLVSTNLFLNQPIKQEHLDKINLSYWLKKYNLELYQTVSFGSFNQAQLQIINFLGLLFSNYKLYFLNQPLSAVSKDDQELLWKLLFEIKKDKYLIIFGELSALEAARCDNLNLDDMI